MSNYKVEPVEDHRVATWARIVRSTLVIFVLMTPGGAAATWLDELVATVDVQLEHPPDLGFTIDRIAFAGATGECSGEFVDSLISTFVDNGVEVVERERLEELLESIDFSASGYVRSEDAVALGQILGPSALVFLDVQRCTEEQDRSSKSYKTKNGTRYTYLATTTAYFKSSLRIVDVASGRIHSSKVVEATRSETNKSSDGYPEYPSKYDLHDAAIGGATVQVHRMFFPWVESRELRFFKDSKCGLKEAYRMVQIGDYEGAAALSGSNLEQCKAQPKTKPKLLARAHYNAGLTRFMQSEHDAALAYFEQAYRIKPGDRMREAVNTCKHAIQLRADMQAYEERLAERQNGGGSQLAVRQPGPEATSVKERLRQLEGLFKEGLLTEEEYQAKRAEIVAEL